LHDTVVLIVELVAVELVLVVVAGVANDACCDAASIAGTAFATAAGGNVVTLERTATSETIAIGAVIASGTSASGAGRAAAVRVGAASCPTARRSDPGGPGRYGTIGGLGTPRATGVGGEASESDINAAATATTPTLAVAVPSICNSLRTVSRLIGFASIPPGTEAISSAEITPT
jgi:hypothetical protein